MQSFAESLPRSNKLVLAEMKLLGKVMHSSKCTQMLKQSRVSSFANGSVKLSTFRRRPWSQGEISPLPVITGAMNMHDEYIYIRSDEASWLSI